MTEYAYIIYQIKNINKTIYAFRSWNEAKEMINLDDYDGKYYGHINAETSIKALEQIFVIFNTHRPNDFKGHSLSVSDVVCLLDDYGNKWYYCDDFSWKEITSELKQRYLN